MTYKTKLQRGLCAFFKCKEHAAISYVRSRQQFCIGHYEKNEAFEAYWRGVFEEIEQRRQQRVAQEKI